MQAQANLVAEVRAFMKSRVILTAAELDLFTHLEQGFVSVKELVARLDLDERAATRLLDCLITFGLLEKQEDRYRTTSLGALLSARHPESILPSVRHSNRLWHAWSQLTATVKAKDWKKFEAAFKEAEVACNGCHAANGFPYIKYELPRSSPSPTSNKP